MFLHMTEAQKVLIASDFVIRYVPFGCGKREERYKLIDPSCIFYIKYVENRSDLPDGFLQQNITSQSIVSWRGYAFENVCFDHIPQIKSVLGISGISTTQSAWAARGDSDEPGMQIDLIISRRDNVVNMCEMKFYSEEFVMNKKYDFELRHRKCVLEEMIPHTSAVQSVLITTYGIKYNEYRWAFENVVTMDVFFK